MKLAVKRARPSSLVLSGGQGFSMDEAGSRREPALKSQSYLLPENKMSMEAPAC
jgi:hypothetical protein